MATVLHSWLSHAQETTRYDSVAAKYGLVVDTPSGMSQTGHNALRFLRSLSEHSPTFFEGQARLLSTPDPSSPMGGPQRPARRTSRADPDEALFALDMPDDPLFQSRAHRARPYPALPRIHPDLVAAPLGASSALKHPPHQAVQSGFAQQHVQPALSPLLSFAPPPEPELVRTPDDVDRARMSAFMYGSMRAHTVVAASETDTQRW